MILQKTERVYAEGVRKWMKHGLWDKEITYQIVKRTSIKVLFIPVFWVDKIIKTDLLK